MVQIISFSFFSFILKKNPKIFLYRTNKSMLNTTARPLLKRLPALTKSSHHYLNQQFSRLKAFTPKIAKLTQNPYLVSEKEFKSKMLSNPQQFCEGFHFLLNNTSTVLKEPTFNNIEENLLEQFYELNFNLMTQTNRMKYYLIHLGKMEKMKESNPALNLHFHHYVSSLNLSKLEDIEFFRSYAVLYHMAKYKFQIPHPHFFTNIASLYAGSVISKEDIIDAKIDFFKNTPCHVLMGLIDMYPAFGKNFEVLKSCLTRELTSIVMLLGGPQSFKMLSNYRQLKRIIEKMYPASQGPMPQEIQLIKEYIENDQKSLKTNNTQSKGKDKPGFALTFNH